MAQRKEGKKKRITVQQLPKIVFLCASNMWSSLTWFGLHVFIHLSLPFASPSINMGPITKAAVAVIQFALWVDKVRNSWIFNFLWKAGT